jgi:hypothetical protein
MSGPDHRSDALASRTRLAAVGHGRDTLDPLELAAVVLIIAVAVIAALRYYEIALAKAESSEALSVTQLLRREVVEFHARHGRWPDGADLDLKRWDPGITSIEVEGGAITVTYGRSAPALTGRRLTLRPVVVPHQIDAPVRWTCGPRRPAAPAVAIGVDRSDMPEHHLIHLCRNGATP